MTILALALALLVQSPPVAVVDSPAPPVHVLVLPGPSQPMSMAMPMPAPPATVRPPQPRFPIEAMIHVEDYPASALRNREQGRVGYTLLVGPNGRVPQCMVTRSSGSSALDSTTCRLLRSRARFTPAADSNGNPAPALAHGELEWRLP